MAANSGELVVMTATGDETVMVDVVDEGVTAEASSSCVELIIPQTATHWMLEVERVERGQWRLWRCARKVWKLKTAYPCW